MGVAAKLPKLDGTGPGASVSVHELTSQDRERVLELLLSQQRVVQLLYSKTFPNRPPTPPADESATAQQDDLGWLGDVMGENLLWALKMRAVGAFGWRTHVGGGHIGVV